MHWGSDTPTEYTFAEGMTWEDFCNDLTFNIEAWSASEYEVNTYYEGSD
jgi:hypothetical protein